MEVHVVRFVTDGVIKVIQRRFPLNGEYVKGVKTIERKGGLRPGESRREPARAHELGTSMNDTVSSTVTIVNRNRMDARGIEDAEVRRSARWCRTWATTVTELYTESKAFEGNFLKKLAVPMLRYVGKQSR